MKPPEKLCARCFTVMEIGIAIEPRIDYASINCIKEFPDNKVTWPLNIEEVYKCPKCGHSDILPGAKNVLY